MEDIKKEIDELKQKINDVVFNIQEYKNNTTNTIIENFNKIIKQNDELKTNKEEIVEETKTDKNIDF